MNGVNDFEFIESLLRASIPVELKNLYVSGEIKGLRDIIVDEVDDETQETLYICLDNWEPLNPESYEHPWPGTERTLNFGSDSSGNMYIAKPEEGFKLVYFYDHETEEIESLGIDIPTFISKLKKWKKD